MTPKAAGASTGEEAVGERERPDPILLAITSQVRGALGFGEALVGKLVLIDALTMRFETLRYGWDEANPLNGTGANEGRS